MCLIGTCGLAINGAFRSTSIGFQLERRFWGQGLMREALSSIVDHAYDRWDINRIQATGDLDNHASMGLLRSLGFIEEGIMRQWGYWKDAFQTFVPYNCYLAIPNLKAQFDTSA
jgi:ribosomal-protein-alanine N-acetyltransferase